MTAFTDKTAEISRTPVQLFVLTADKCSLTFGVGACEATLADNSPEKLLNSFLENWTGGDPDNWTVAIAGGENPNNYVDQNPDVAVGGGVLVSDNTKSIYLIQDGVCEVGKTYRYKVVVPTLGAGVSQLQVRNEPLGFIAFMSEGINTGTFTAQGTDFRCGNSTSGTTNGSVIAEISIKEEVPGTECYNTFFTCKDKVNFDKTTEDLKFTSFEAPIPFSGIRPYIKKISSLPTKIENELTVRGRRKVEMVDELSDDINIDPYQSTRASVQGEFWKKFVARNPNYNGRPVAIFEGYLGLTEAQFEQRWTGTLGNITINNDVVMLSCVDNLAELEKLTVPDDIKANTLTALTDSQDYIGLDTILKADGTQIDAAGYVRIDDEVIQYASLNVPSNQLLGCTRGEFSTTAATHGEAVAVGIVKYYEPDNPFDIMQAILNDAGIDNADIDTTAWAYWKDWPKTDIDYSAIITKDDGVTGQDLFWEIANLVDVHVWQDEDQEITIRRNVANEPGRTYTDLTDTSNIISKTGNSDYNEQSRRTRFLMYWGKGTLADLTSIPGYTEVDIAIDADAEGANGYNDIRDEVIFCRWFSKRYLQEEIVERYAASLVRRKLLNRSNAVPLISASVELKDEGLKTGDNVVLTTDEILQSDGNPITDNYMIISRDKMEGRVNFQLVKFPKHRICFIATNGITDYDSATDPERENGFVANENGQMPNGDPGYLIW